MKKIIILFLICAVLFVRVPTANALFGSSNLPLLAKIVSNTMETIVRLGRLVNLTNETLSLQRKVQAGIDQTLRRVDAIASVADKKTWRDIRSASDALNRLKDVFGDVVSGPSKGRLDHVDQVTAEALLSAKEIEVYSDSADNISLSLQNQSLNASPMRAMQIQAQGTAALIALEAQGQRNDAQIIKLLSTMAAEENRKEKLRALHRDIQYKEMSKHLSRSSFTLNPVVAR